MPATTYLSHALLNEVFRGVNYPQNGGTYLALFSTPTDDAGGGTELTTTTAPGYARLSIPAASFSAPANKTISNVAALLFAAATGNWPLITHIAIFDSLTAGNMLTHGPLSTPILVVSGQQAQFNTSDLKATL